MDWIEKISDAEIKEKGVSALSNRPNLNNAYGAGGLTAKQLKEWFDQLAKLIIERQNEIIDKTDPNTYAKGLPMDISGNITTLAEFIAALKDGTLADEGLMVENGEEKVSLASFLGDLVSDLSVIESEFSTGLAGKVDKITDPYSVYTTNKDGELNPVKVVTSPASGAIPVYFGTSLRTGTPLSDLDATNMGYVDTNTPAHIVASMNTIEGEGEEKKEYVLRLSLVNRKGDVIPDSETSIDLPLEMAFVGAEAVEDENGNEFVEFALQNGAKLRVGLSEIFKGKVDKVNTKRILYGTGNNGEPVQRYISQTPSANAVPQYSSDGRLQTNAPVEDQDTANKKSVEDGLANKVNAQFFSSGKNRMYCARANDPNSYYDIDSKPWMDCIPIYTNVESNITPSTSVYGQATIVVVDPKRPFQVANMRYVDRKDEELESSIDELMAVAIGTLTDFKTVSSAVNPVTVPIGALAEANIDKIGTGIKTEAINEAEPSANNVTSNGITVTYDGATDLYTLSSDYEEAIGIPTLTIKTPINVTEGEKFYISFEFVSGSVESSAYDYFMLGSWQYNVSVHFGETHVLGECVASSDKPISELTFNLSAAPCKFNNFTFRLHIGKRKQTYGVPVASVKKGDDTIYTVPEAIRALTYSVLGDSQTYPVYGLALSDTMYNYLDLDRKQYVVKCAVNPGGMLEEVNDTIDVSAYLTDEDGEITVAAGDEILFVDTDGNSAGSTVPSTITYIVKKGASE